MTELALHASDVTLADAELQGSSSVTEWQIDAVSTPADDATLDGCSCGCACGCGCGGISK